MSDKYNGGITLGIGDYTLKHISAYTPAFTHEYDSSNSFENFDFEQTDFYKGMRFSANITAGILAEAEMNKLWSQLSRHEFNFTSPEYSGMVKIINVPKKYESANRYGKFFSCSFSVAALALSGSSGGL